MQLVETHLLVSYLATRRVNYIPSCVCSSLSIAVVGRHALGFVEFLVLRWPVFPSYLLTVSSSAPKSPSSRPNTLKFSTLYIIPTLSKRSDSGVVTEPTSGGAWPQVCCYVVSEAFLLGEDGLPGHGNGGVVTALHLANGRHHPGSPLE